jgi:hypothetical protein
MEPKGMMDKMRPQRRADFIGKKCQKFIEFGDQPKNTVSIVPIIGKHTHLSEFTTAPGQVSSIKTRPEFL